MNTYLFPICDVRDNIAWIEKIRARNLASAEEKLVQMLMEDYEEYDSNFTLDNMTEDERANTSPEEIILNVNVIAEIQEILEELPTKIPKLNLPTSAPIR